MERTADECRLLSENQKYRELADRHASSVAKLATTYQKVDKKAFHVMEKNRECAKAVGRHIKCLMTAITNGLEEDETVNAPNLKKDLAEIVKNVEMMKVSTAELGEMAKLMAAEVAVEQDHLKETVKAIEEMVSMDKEKEGGREKAFLLSVLAAPMTGGVSLLLGGAFLAGMEVATRDGLQGARSRRYLLGMHEQLDEVCVGLGGRCEQFERIVKALNVLKDSLERGAKIQVCDCEDLVNIANQTTGNLEAIADSYDDVLGQQDDSSRLKAIQDDVKARKLAIEDVSTAASSRQSSRSTSPASVECGP